MLSICGKETVFPVDFSWLVSLVAPLLVLIYLVKWYTSRRLRLHPRKQGTEEMLDVPLLAVRSSRLDSGSLPVSMSKETNFTLAPVLEGNNDLLEGYLDKWEGIHGHWVARYFVIDDNAAQLRYYASQEAFEEGRPPRGYIRLLNIQVTDSEAHPTVNSSRVEFTISEGKDMRARTVICVSAADEDTKGQWAIALLSRRNYGSARTIDFRMHDLGLKLKTNGAVVLNGVTGEIKHRRLTGIMGPSGCGKSTFLTTLAGRAHYGNTTGNIFINGVVDPISKFKTEIGFVPQEDVMVRTLTVSEILFHSAYSRLPKSMTSTEVRNQVEKVLDVLQLQELRNSTIGDELKRGISGGQRKRVNIGIELVAAPVVLFLDEPTSGLDSTSSQDVMEALQNISHSGLGLTVVAVIHQPRYSIFQMFDDMFLLGKGGRVVYAGPAQDNLSYFEQLGFTCPPFVNPPDFFLDLISAAGEGTLELEGKVLEKHYLFDKWADKQQESLEASAERKLSNLNHTTHRTSHTTHRTSLLNKSIRKPASCYFICLGGLCGILGLGLIPLHRWGYKYKSVRYAALLVAICTISGTWHFFVSQNWSDFAGISLAGIIVVVLATALVLLRSWTQGYDEPFELVYHFYQNLGALNLLLIPFVYSLIHSRSTGRTRAISVIATTIFAITQMTEAYLLFNTLGIYSIGDTHETLLTTWAAAIFLVVCGVFMMRYKTNLTLTDGCRERRSFPQLLWLETKRGLLEFIADYHEVCFDLALCIVLMTILGLIYGRTSFVGPLPVEMQKFCILGMDGSTFSDFCAAPTQDDSMRTGMGMLIAIGMCGASSSVRIFSKQKAVFERESASGLRAEAYFFGRCLAHLPLLVLTPTLAVCAWMFTAEPVISFWSLWSIFFLTYSAGAAIGYLTSVFCHVSAAYLFAVSGTLLFYFLLETPILEMSPFYWGIRLYVTTTLDWYSHMYPIDSTLELYDYTPPMHEYLPYFVLFTMGMLLRLFAFLGLVRTEQKS